MQNGTEIRGNEKSEAEKWGKNTCSGAAAAAEEEEEEDARAMEEAAAAPEAAASAVAPAEVPAVAEAPAEAPAPASEPGSASSAVPEIPNSSWSSTNRSEADNEVAAGGDGAAAAAGAGVVDAGPVQQIVPPLNYAETVDMPVGTSIGIVGADGVMFSDDDDGPIAPPPPGTAARARGTTGHVALWDTRGTPSF